MNFNPMQLFQMMKSNNPKDIVMNMIKQQSGNNPMINNLIDMANNGNTQGVETFARNLCKNKGMDFDTEFGNFMQQMNNQNTKN